MDHWGDPWAEDSDTKSAPKETVTTPPPLPSAPVLLNGFLDDARWGFSEHDGGFGGWATSPGYTDVVHPTGLQMRAADTTPTTNPIESQADTEAFTIDDEGWRTIAEEQESPSGSDKVVSEASDSATTIQADDLSAHEFQSASKVEDDLSTRPSTSPSDASLTEAPTESPRTSFEDERAVRHNGTNRKGSVARADEPAMKEATESIICPVEGSRHGSEDDDFGEFEEDDNKETGKDAQTEEPLWEEQTSTAQRHKRVDRYPQEHNGQTSEETLHGQDILEIHSYTTPDIDLALVNQLFPYPKSASEIKDGPDDPICTTSARRAWYRLTRKQTLREFNSGNDDDNYVRVTWATSQIRSDVIKTVGRWQNEDRTSGRGQAGGVGFNWDPWSAPHAQVPNLHSHKKSSSTITPQIQPVKQRLPSLSTSTVPASFSWSSSPVPENEPGLQVASSPLTATQKHIQALQSQNHDAASLEPAGFGAGGLKQGAPSTSFPFTETTADLPNPPSTSNRDSGELFAFTTPLKEENGPENSHVSLQETPSSVTAPSGLTTTPLDTKADPLPITSDEEDDDWGEMMDSSAMSITPTLPGIVTQSNRVASSIQSENLSKPSKPSLLNTSKPQLASPIVRLKTIVSPTSARFGFDGLIPPNAEVGPIGPSILKPVSRSTAPLPRGARIGSRAESNLDEIAGKKQSSPVLESNKNEEFSAFASSLPQAGSQLAHEEPPSVDIIATNSPVPAPESTSLQPTTSASHEEPLINSPDPPTPPPTLHLNPDPFSDADFSIFESSVPISTIPTKPSFDPSDPFSIFESTPPISVGTTPPRPAPSAPFTRSPPRPTTPPPKLPLTGASNSALRRKAEEDELIRGIVGGLSDLGYMLRR